MGTSRRGLLSGVAAYLIWGLLPVYWPLLKPAGAIEILAHRMVWTLVVVVSIIAVGRSWRKLRALLADRRRVALLSLAAGVIAVNWGTYIWGVNHNHVVETSLGYFINPLVTVLLGVVVLHERLRRVQWLAIGLGGLSVVVLAIDYGRLPWLALVLALSFGTYGLIKKHVGAGAIESVSVETGVLFLPALAYLLYLGAAGQSTFGHHGAGQALLLAASGLVTAVPLLFFGTAARTLPLTTLGLLQYLAPVLQFGAGVLLFHEPMPAARLAGFALIWVALVILSADSLRHQRGSIRRARAAGAVPPPAAALEDIEAAGEPAGR